MALGAFTCATNLLRPDPRPAEAHGQGSAGPPEGHTHRSGRAAQNAPRANRIQILHHYQQEGLALPLAQCRDLPEDEVPDLRAFLRIRGVGGLQSHGKVLGMPAGAPAQAVPAAVQADRDQPGPGILPLLEPRDALPDRQKAVLDRIQGLANDLDYEVEADLLQAREVGPALVDEAVDELGSRREPGERDCNIEPRLG